MHVVEGRELWQISPPNPVYYIRGLDFEQIKQIFVNCAKCGVSYCFFLHPWSLIDLIDVYCNYDVYTF